MNLSTILILAGVVAALIFAIRYVVKHGACGGCPGSKSCHASHMHSGSGQCSGSCSACHACGSSHITPCENKH